MEIFVHGLFREEANAALAVRSLVDAHFEPDQISALMRVGTDPGADELKPIFKMATGPGAALGTALGAVGGALLALGGLLVAGPVFAGVAGGVSGALAGALGGLGRWTEEIDFPKHVEGGMILVGVATQPGRLEQARAALAGAHAARVHVSKKGEACEEVESGVLSKTGVVS